MLKRLRLMGFAVILVAGLVHSTRPVEATSGWICVDIAQCQDCWTPMMMCGMACGGAYDMDPDHCVIEGEDCCWWCVCIG